MAEKPIPAHVRRIVELWHMRKTYKEIIAILEAEGVRVSRSAVKKYVSKYSDLIAPPKGFAMRAKQSSSVCAVIKRAVELWHMRKTPKEILATLQADGMNVSQSSMYRYIFDYADLIDPPKGVERRIKRESTTMAIVKKIVELWHMRKTYGEILDILQADGARISKSSIDKYVGKYADLIGPPEGYSRRMKLVADGGRACKRAVELWHRGKTYREISCILEDEGMPMSYNRIYFYICKYADIIGPPKGFERRIKQPKVRMDKAMGETIKELWRAGKTYKEIAEHADNLEWGMSYDKIKNYVRDNIIAPRRQQKKTATQPRRSIDDYSDLIDIKKPKPQNPTMPEFKPNEHYIFYEQNTAQRPPVTKVLTFKALNKDKALFANEFGHRETFTASQLVDYKIQPAASA